MPSVTIQLRSLLFQLACDEGQEVYLQSLAETLNKRMGLLAQQYGSRANDQLLLTLAALLMEDEIRDLKQSHLQENNSMTVEDHQRLSNKEVQRTVETISSYLESIAQELENT
jgi:cell division protein ZapA (FtsZ GTPase activity inhibitor)